MRKTPTYRIESPYICFQSKARAVACRAWKTKEHGEPTPENIQKWIDQTNADMSNEQRHLQSAHSSGKIVRQSTGKVVAEFTYAAFMVID